MGPMSLYEYCYMSFGNSGEQGHKSVAEAFQRRCTNLVISTKKGISLLGKKVSVFCGEILGQFAKEQSSSILVSREQYEVSR